MTNVATPYAVGDVIRVLEGPFARFVGTVRRIDEARGDLQVVVTMFGHPVPIDAEAGQVARA
jgi:transcriptional antiterminator NusG